jgi:hypothetical protein
VARRGGPTTAGTFSQVDLQWEDRFRTQRLPGWAASVSADDAKAYCTALARACRADSLALAKGQRANCARCQPRLRAASWASARKASALPPGGRCKAEQGQRLLTQSECIALARVRQMTFIGVQVPSHSYEYQCAPPPRSPAPPRP